MVLNDKNIKSLKNKIKLTYGVYCIYSELQDVYYIGSSSKCLYDRIRLHLGDLKLNRHHSKYLQRSWNKYGQSNFTFKIIENVEDPKDCIEREQFWMDYYDSFKNGFNATPAAGSRLGAVLSEETKKKIRKTLTGRKLPRDRVENAAECARISICQINTNGELVKVWKGIHKTAESLGMHCTNIVRVLKGKAKWSGGYTWVYLDEYDPEKDYSFDPTRGKEVIRISDDGEEVIYGNSHIAAKENSLHHSGILAVIHGIQHKCGGFKWRQVGKEYKFVGREKYRKIK